MSDVAFRPQDLRVDHLFESVRDAIIVADTHTGRIVLWNPAATETFGYSLSEALGMNIAELVPERLREQHRVGLARYRETGHGPYIDSRALLELSAVRKTGEEISIEMSLNPIEPIRDLANEESRFVLAIVRDITERKRAEIRFRTLVEQTPAVTYIQEPIESSNPKAVTYMSPQYETMLGYPVGSKVIGEERWLRTIHPEDQARVLAEEARTDQSGEPFKMEYRVIAADSQVVWVRDEASLVCDEEGKPLYWLGVQYDVTEHKRAEAALQRSLDALLALYETGQLLTSSLEREEIGSRLLGIIEQVSGTTAAVIYLGEDRNCLHAWRTIGPESLLASIHDEPEGSAARQAAFETEEGSLLEMENPRLQGEHLAVLVLPLRARDRTIGVLEVYGSRRLAENRAMETFASVANQAASALENARLYEELSEHRRQLQEFVGKLVRAQEEERRRVAYEVHDGLAQVAAAAYQHMQNFAADNPPTSPCAQEDLGQALEMLQQTVDMRPTVLDDFGLATALRLQVERLSEGGLRASYEDTMGGERLPEAVETALFRVAQEALTNVRKHARADSVHVALERRGQAVRLQVRDWGRGFVPDSVTERGDPGQKVGLSSMRERVALLGGHFEIHSEPGAGTVVVADVPLKEEDAPEERSDDGE
jgi:PAS domain S-box-containing protein